MIQFNFDVYTNGKLLCIPCPIVTTHFTPVISYIPGYTLHHFSIPPNWKMPALALGCGSSKPTRTGLEIASQQKNKSGSSRVPGLSVIGQKPCPFLACVFFMELRLNKSNSQMAAAHNVYIDVCECVYRPCVVVCIV